MNLTGFIHDTNPGMGPEVSTVDSGNGFGTRVFWTAVVPDSDVEVNPGAGTAEMHVHNLPELDYYSPDGNAALLSLGPTWQSGYFDSTASFDVVWNGPVTRRVNVKDAANGFAGTFNENQATVTWSTNSTSGFSFVSNPGDFSTSVPEVPGVNGVTAPLNFFAEVGHERNGIFFAQGDNSQEGNQGGNSAVSKDTSAILVMSTSKASVPGAEAFGMRQGQSAALPPRVAISQASAETNGHPAMSGTASRLHVSRQLLDHVFADVDGDSFRHGPQRYELAVWAV